MKKLIGRREEITLFNNLQNSEIPAFVAMYGRRRVGKTFLVRQVFNNTFSFYFTGTANINTAQQLANFHAALSGQIIAAEHYPVPKDWFEAFRQLSTALNTLSGKKVIFLDELPWLDTPKSGFIPALEYFWNSWGSAQPDILLITCGSAASWMINNLINHRGGLHNRVTHRIQLEPFTLGECELFFEERGAAFGRYQIIQLYMVTGGIPFYLDQVDKGLTATQNIDRLCFSKNGLLRTEFDNLYTSLFKKADKHVAIIEILAGRNKGMSREEIIKKSGISDGGSLTRLLSELEQSGFIRRYKTFGHTVRDTQYQVSDFYSLFYLRFIKIHNSEDQNSWLDRMDNPEVRAWSGYAFEQVCWAHLPQLKQALGISGVQTNTSTWQGSVGDTKAQIDLVIERRDQAINLFEIKFWIDEFTIDKNYADTLRRKINIFKTVTQTRKSVLLTMLTTFGITNNQYAGSIVQKSLTMDALFN